MGAERRENTVHTLGDIGDLMLGVRNDAGGTIADADGKYAPCQFDANGNLRTTGTASLPANAATETTLAAMSAKLPSALGPQTMALSFSITFASNQTALPITVASLPLPAGASTSALQTTGNTSIASIDTKTPALGQAAMGASQPVVIANDQTSIPVTPGRGAVTNRSGTITAGGTAQTLAAVNASRKYLIIQNVSAGDLWINFTTTAIVGQPSVKIGPDASFVMEASFVSTELISIIGATTGQAFAAKEG